MIMDSRMRRAGLVVGRRIEIQGATGALGANGSVLKFDFTFEITRVVELPLAYAIEGVEISRGAQRRRSSPIRYVRLPKDRRDSWRPLRTAYPHTSVRGLDRAFLNRMLQDGAR